MPADEIKKPSLTQRKKSSGSASLSSIVSKSSASKSSPSPIKLTSSSMGSSSKSDGDSGGSEDDISIGKVILVVVAVVIVAVIAAFLVQRLQSPGEETIGDDTVDVTETPEPTEEPEETPTPEPTEEPEETPTPTTTPTPDEDAPTSETTDNEFGQTTQYLVSSLTGNDVRIRTYQFENTSTYYEFRWPFDNGSGSDIDVPNSKASYNDQGDLEVELRNISSFASCNYLNDNNDGLGYDNVVTVTCTPGSGSYTFTFDTLEETDFRLTTGTADLNGDEVETVVIQIKNN